MLVDLLYEEYPDAIDYVYNLHIVTNRCVYTPDSIDHSNFELEPPFEMGDPYTIPSQDLSYKVDQEGFLNSLVGSTSTAVRPFQFVQIKPPCLKAFIGF